MWDAWARDRENTMGYNKMRETFGGRGLRPACTCEHHDERMTDDEFLDKSAAIIRAAIIACRNAPDEGGRLAAAVECECTLDAIRRRAFEALGWVAPRRVEGEMASERAKAGVPK
jgi:hypothetical protein